MQRKPYPAGTHLLVAIQPGWMLWGTLAEEADPMVDGARLSPVYYLENVAQGATITDLAEGEPDPQKVVGAGHRFERADIPASSFSFVAVTKADPESLNPKTRAVRKTR